MRKLTYFINYFYIIFVILWMPLSQTIINFDGKGRMIVFLTFFVIILNFISNRRFQFLLFSKPIIFWGIWVIYSCINLINKGYQGEEPYLFFIVLNLIVPFVVMILDSLEWGYDNLKILKYLLYTFVVYGLLTLALFDDSFSFTGDRNINTVGNFGPLNTMFVVFYSAILFVNKKLKLKNFLFYIIFALLIILLIATRKAFVAVLIMIIFTIISQINISVRNIIRLLAFSLIIFFSTNLILKSTTMGERFSEIEDVGQNFNTTSNQFLDLLGDRAFFYIEGWNQFLKSPITGIGINNFMSLTDTNYSIHSEYMVQITEGGIIGTLLFLFFYYWLIFNLYKSFRKNRETTFVLIGGLIAIIFVNATAWTYAFPQYFACFGIITGYLINTRQ